MDRTVVAPEALGYQAARARVLDAVRPLPEETVPLEECRGRAARTPLIAAIDLPPFRNSSMDGAAVRSLDLTAARAERAVELPVVASLAAGAVREHPLEPGSCVWIMTGAPLPDGADAVVPIEDLLAVEGAAPDRAGGRVRFLAAAREGQNVRDAGADTRAGQMLWEAGRELSAHDVGLLAALGQPRVIVGSRPRAAIVSTGDELQTPDEAPRPGAIRDSNRPMLRALLEESGAHLVSSEHVRDDADLVAAAIDRALGVADVVLTVGGVSAGAFDPVKLGIGRSADIALWRVAMKPGRPQAFGTPRGRWFFGLPGNPASVACVFEALVRPALRKLQGFADLDRPTIVARAEADIESRPGRTDFVRVTLAFRAGEWWAAEAGAQISGHVLPQSRAHALLLLPEEAGGLRKGESARAWVLRWPPLAALGDSR